MSVNIYFPSTLDSGNKRRATPPTPWPHLKSENGTHLLKSLICGLRNDPSKWSVYWDNEKNNCRFLGSSRESGKFIMTLWSQPKWSYQRDLKKWFLIPPIHGPFSGVQKMSHCHSSPQDPGFLSPEVVNRWGGPHLLKSQISQKWTKKIVIVPISRSGEAGQDLVREPL